MCRKLCLLVSLVVVLTLASGASAATQYFLDTTTDNLWMTQGNWSTDATAHSAEPNIPTSADYAYIGGRQTLGEKTCLIQSAEDAFCGTMKIGQYVSTGCILNVDGTVTASQITMGCSAQKADVNDLPDELNIAAGATVAASGSIIIGTYTDEGAYSSGWGIITMNGGTVDCSSYFGCGDRGDAPPVDPNNIPVGTLHLYDGVFNCGDLLMNGAGFIDVNEGIMWITGDVATKVQGYVDAGWIQAVGSTETIDVAVAYVVGDGKTRVRKALPEDKEKASAPDPGRDAVDVAPTAILSWTAGLNTVSHDIRFGTVDPPPLVVPGQGVGNETYDPTGDMALDTVHYWRIDENDGNTTWTGDVWKFTTLDGKASNPSPSDEAEAVLKDGTVLSWDAGFYATGHDVYFGTNSGLVTTRDGTVKVADNQPGTTYPAGTLDRNMTYYWAVDEVGPPDVAGDVWEFKTEAYEMIVPTASITGTPSAENAGRPCVRSYDRSGLSDDGICHNVVKGTMFEGSSGTELHCGTIDGGANLWVEYEFDRAFTLDEIWVWNFNRTTDYDDTKAGIKDVFVEVSTVGGCDPNDWTLVFDGEWPKAPGDACGVDYCYEGFQGVDFGACTDVKYVVITPNCLEGRGNWISDSARFGLSEVEFRMCVTFAKNPIPPDGAVLAESERDTLLLQWTGGIGAVDHRVYFGDDAADVFLATPGSPEDKLLTGGPAQYDASGEPMVLGGEYFWRIDEVDSGANVEKGMVWSFSIVDYLVADDMESYDLDPGGDAMMNTWEDGYYNGTGAMVGTKNGYDPYNENTIVHGGGQAMYYEYDNDGTHPYYGSPDLYSESSAAASDLVIGTDWDRDGAKSLDIWFRGTTGNAAEQLYMALDDGSTKTVVNYSGSASDLAKEEWQVYRVALSDFNGVVLDTVSKVYIGFGDPENPQSGGEGTMYFDDMRLYAGRCIPEWLGDPLTADLSDPTDCKVDMKDLGILTDKWLAKLLVVPKPVAQYKLDGDATDAVGTQDGTENGSPAYDVGKIGLAIVLDGTDDNVVVPDGGTTEFSTESFSVSYWMKPDIAGTGWNYVLINGSCGTEYQPKPPGGHRYETGFNDTTGTVFFCIDDDPADSAGTDKSDVRGDDLALLDGEWHHVVCVREVPVELRLYVDGAPFGAETRPYKSPNIASPDEPLVIGARWSGSAYIDCFNGMLDDIKFFDVVLGEAQIKDIALGKGMMAHYELEGNANDSVGTQDGTEVGSPAYGVGQYGQAIIIDGTDDYVSIPDGGTTEFGEVSFSVSYWQKPTQAAGSWRQVLINGSCGTEYQPKPPGGCRYEIVFDDSTDTLTWCIDTDIPSKKSTMNVADPGFGTTDWQHVVCVRDVHSEIREYLNGALIGSADDISFDITSPNEPLLIGTKWKSGAPDATYHFDGMLDDIRFYNFAMTEEDMAEATYAPPIAQWLFDEAPAGVTPDAIGSADLTLVGDAQIVTDPDRDKVISFDGDGDYATRPGGGITELGYTSFTIGVWVNIPVENQVYSQIVNSGSWGGESGGPYEGTGKRYEMCYTTGTTGGEFTFAIDDGGPDVPGVQGKTFLKFYQPVGSFIYDEWQHVACVRDLGVELRSYLDAEPTTEYASGSGTFKTDVTGDIASPNEPLNVGANMPQCTSHSRDHFLLGMLDDLREYTYPMNQGQVELMVELAEMAEDLNEDGIVNFEDYAILADQYGDTKYWPLP